MGEGKDMVAGLAIQIPDKMIAAVIMAEVAKAMPDRDKWIEAVVKTALTEKVNSYDRNTKFESVVNGMIQNVAAGVMQEWIESNRDKIHAAFIEALEKNKKKRIKELADKMVDGLTSVYIDSIKLRLTEPD